MSATLTIVDSDVELSSTPAEQRDDWIIRQAIALLEQRVFDAGPMLRSRPAVRDDLRLKLMAEPQRAFRRALPGQPKPGVGL